MKGPGRATAAQNVKTRGVRGQTFILLAAVLWGTTGTAQTFAPVGASPLTVGTLRLVIGGTALLLAVLARGRVVWRWHPALLTASVGVAVYQITFFAGVVRTGVAAGTLVAIASAPVFAGLLESLVLRERPSSRWLGATALAIVGTALLIGARGSLGVDWVGALLSLVAGASFAVYTVGHRAAVKHLPADLIPAVALFGGGLLLVPILFFQPLQWLLRPAGVAVAFHLGIVTAAVAYFLYGRGLKTTSAAAATTLSLAEPVTASILGVVVLGERLTPLATAGAGLVFIALLLLATADGREAEANRGGA